MNREKVLGISMLKDVTGGMSCGMSAPKYLDKLSKLGEAGKLDEFNASFKGDITEQIGSATFYTQAYIDALMNYQS